MPDRSGRLVETCANGSSVSLQFARQSEAPPVIVVSDVI